MALPLTVDDWPAGAGPHRAAAPARARGARPRARSSTSARTTWSTAHLGGGQDRATLDATLPEVPADRPAQFVLEHDGRFVGWMGLGRRDTARPGRATSGERRARAQLRAARSLPGDTGTPPRPGVAILAWAAERFDEPVVVCTQSANTALPRPGRAAGLHRARAVRGVRRRAVVRRTGAGLMATIRRATPDDAATMRQRRAGGVRRLRAADGPPTAPDGRRLRRRGGRGRGLGRRASTARSSATWCSSTRAARCCSTTWPCSPPTTVEASAGRC